MTDIEGSTRLWEEHPEAMSEALRHHDDLMREAIEASGGYVFKTIGDAFCAAFSHRSGRRASCRSCPARPLVEPWPDSTTVRVRMGLHTGECEERDGDYFGPAVNRVARLIATAHGGQVVLSRSTADVVTDHVRPGVSLRDLGTHHLKDLSRPEVVFQLDVDGLPTEFPPLRSLDNPALLNNLPEFALELRRPGYRDGRGAQARLGQPPRHAHRSRGAGKTRLAIQVAAELFDGTGDGVWFVDLAPLADPELVADSVATAIGVREEPGRPVAATLVDALRERNLLVVLDNCEHLVDACAKLTDAILRSCPEVHVIATSREPLGLDGERVFRVPSLSLPPAGTATLDRTDALGFEAVQLFVDRARPRPRFRSR